MTVGAAIPRVRLRRSAPPFRVELTPLIDVVFLLLTFFIYAMVLMERIELVPMELRSFGTFDAEQFAEPPPARTLSLDANGAIFLDRAPIALDAVVPALEAAIAENPDTVLYLAIADSIGPRDRVPMLLELWNELRTNEIPIRMVGTPDDEK